MVSLFIGPVAIGICLLLLIAYNKNKIQILAYTIYIIFLVIASCFLKQLVANPRPFWSSSEVKVWSWDCPKDYGNPSGHSFLAWILLELIVLHLIMNEKLQVQNFSKKIVFYIIYLVCIGLVMFSRMSLGVHSLNQVLLGSLLGLYSVIAYKLYVEGWLTSQIEKRYSTTLQSKKTLILCTVATQIITFFIPMIIYTIENRQKDLE